tara:strand:- start:4718 stop:8032 length:3315 start_codon:yes stop_codon:yes gene_type:complete
MDTIKKLRRTLTGTTVTEWAVLASGNIDIYSTIDQYTTQGNRHPVLLRSVKQEVQSGTVNLDDANRNVLAFNIYLDPNFVTFLNDLGEEFFKSFVLKMEDSLKALPAMFAKFCTCKIYTTVYEEDQPIDTDKAFTIEFDVGEDGDFDKLTSIFGDFNLLRSTRMQDSDVQPYSTTFMSYFLVLFEKESWVTLAMKKNIEDNFLSKRFWSAVVEMYSGDLRVHEYREGFTIKDYMGRILSNALTMIGTFFYVSASGIREGLRLEDLEKLPSIKSEFKDINEESYAPTDVFKERHAFCLELIAYFRKHLNDQEWSLLKCVFTTPNLAESFIQNARELEFIEALEHGSVEYNDLYKGFLSSLADDAEPLDKDFSKTQAPETEQRTPTLEDEDEILVPVKEDLEAAALVTKLEELKHPDLTERLIGKMTFTEMQEAYEKYKDYVPSKDLKAVCTDLRTKLKENPPKAGYSKSVLETLAQDRIIGLALNYIPNYVPNDVIPDLTSPDVTGVFSTLIKELFEVAVSMDLTSVLALDSKAAQIAFICDYAEEHDECDLIIKPMLSPTYLTNSYAHVRFDNISSTLVSLCSGYLPINPDVECYDSIPQSKKPGYLIGFIVQLYLLRILLRTLFKEIVDIHATPLDLTSFTLDKFHKLFFCVVTTFKIYNGDTDDFVWTYGSMMDKLLDHTFLDVPEEIDDELLLSFIKESEYFSGVDGSDSLGEIASSIFEPDLEIVLDYFKSRHDCDFHDYLDKVIPKWTDENPPTDEQYAELGGLTVLDNEEAFEDVDMNLERERLITSICYTFDYIPIAAVKHLNINGLEALYHCATSVAKTDLDLVLVSTLKAAGYEKVYLIEMSQQELVELYIEHLGNEDSEVLPKDFDVKKVRKYIRKNSFIEKELLDRLEPLPVYAMFDTLQSIKKLANKIAKKPRTQSKVVDKILAYYEKNIQPVACSISSYLMHLMVIKSRQMSVNTDKENFDKCNEVRFEELQNPIEALNIDYCTTWVQQDEFVDFVLDMLDKMGYDSLPNEDEEADDDDELINYGHAPTEVSEQDEDSFDAKTNKKLKRKLAMSIRNYLTFLHESGHAPQDVDLIESSNDDILEYFEFDLS